jgi:hypothetical protein
VSEHEHRFHTEESTYLEIPVGQPLRLLEVRTIELRIVFQFVWFLNAVMELWGSHG